ncbi:MFS transporter [uncultured Formosa sp.]|uniref:MFS transporter n=1 Tax=uncultured Formosa sp. TaxID=255435 RepID=UPI00260DE557|nr:MFS transporter [uncultured Formosa sp.]
MKEKIKVLTIIHLALSVGLIIVYMVLGDVKALTSFSFKAVNAATVIFLIIPIMSVFLSEYIFNSQIKRIDIKLKLEEKMGAYQTASITRWAILEGSAFLLVFMKKDFMIFGILIILYFILIRPTEDRIKMDLS